MSIQLVGQVIDMRDKMKPACKLVLLLLANRADEFGECWPTQERMAAEAGISERSVRDHLQWLEDSGFITRETQHRGQGLGSRTTFRFAPEKFAGANFRPARNCTLTGEGSPLTNHQEPSYSKTSSSRAARKTLRGDWVPGEDEIKYAVSKGFTVEGVENEIEKFTSWHDANGAKFVSWPARWKHWVRMSLDRANNSHPAGRPNQSDAAFDRVKAQILRAEGVAAKEAERNPDREKQALLDFDTHDLDG